MYIGRIITNMRKVDTIDFVEKSSKTDSIDTSIPTLIIGKELAESVCGKENIHVLDKKIGKNLYWTYTKLEKRNEFENDLLMFNELVVSKLSNSVKYTFINIFCESLARIKSIIGFIRNDSDKIFYLTDRHIYLYYEGNVIGFSLDYTRYIGIKDDKIRSLIKEGKNNIILDNDSFISYKMKMFIPSCNILVPYLYFLKNK